VVTEKTFNQLIIVTKERLIAERFEQPYLKANLFFKESVKNNFYKSESLLKVT